MQEHGSKADSSSVHFHLKNDISSRDFGSSEKCVCVCLCVCVCVHGDDGSTQQLVFGSRGMFMRLADTSTRMNCTTVGKYLRKKTRPLVLHARCTSLDKMPWHLILEEGPVPKPVAM